jgi:hypothetical protein
MPTQHSHQSAVDLAIFLPENRAQYFFAMPDNGDDFVGIFGRSEGFGVSLRSERKRLEVEGYSSAPGGAAIAAPEQAVFAA